MNLKKNKVKKQIKQYIMDKKYIDIAIHVKKETLITFIMPLHKGC